MRASAITASLALLVTLVVGAAFLAVDVFWLGRIDPKWGGPWDNFVFGLQLLSIATVVEAAFLGLFVALGNRRVYTSRRPRLVAAVVMAGATILIWPPTSRHPLLMAELVAAIALLAGVISSRFTSGEGQTPLKDGEVVAGA